jgi:hypothetical protein
MAAAATITPIVPLTEDGALDWLRTQPGGRVTATAAELGRRSGWHRQRVGRRLTAWAKSGLVALHGKTVTVVEPALLVPVTPVAERPDRLNSPPAPAIRDETAPAAYLVTPAPRPVTPPVTCGVDAAAYTAAIGLAGVAAWFSISGMVTLFPGSPQSVVTMAAVMEASKLVTAAFLAARWSAAWSCSLRAAIAASISARSTGHRQPRSSAQSSSMWS